jgi:uncharacterized protein
LILSRATFRFYAELNDFLPLAKRGVPFEHEFSGRPAVKDAIESLGVPHTEVDLVLLDGQSVDFGAAVSDGARVSVFPVFESIDIGPIARVRPQPLREPRFVLDVHLGRLAAYLRMLGFDVLFRNDSTDRELARIAQLERRILLTRDRDLLKRSAVTHGYWMRQTSPRRQVVEVLRRFDLRGSISPFERCLRCNQPLVTVHRSEIEQRLPERIRDQHREFKTCRACERIYWKGSHHRRMEQLIAELSRQLAAYGNFA